MPELIEEIVPTAGDVIRLREARGLSRERLAQRAGLSPRTLYNLERGLVTPHRATLAVVAAVLASQTSEGPPAGALAKNAAPPAHENPT